MTARIAAFLKIERKDLIGKEHLRTRAVMSRLPVLPADIMQMAGTLEQEAVMCPRLCRGCRLSKSISARSETCRLCGQSFGIFLCKTSNCINCIGVRI